MQFTDLRIRQPPLLRPYSEMRTGRIRARRDVLRFGDAAQKNLRIRQMSPVGGGGGSSMSNRNNATYRPHPFGSGHLFLDTAPIAVGTE